MKTEKHSNIPTMKIILFLLCIGVVSSLRAQDARDSVNLPKERRLISEKYTMIQDTSGKIDTIQKSRSVSELFYIGQNATKQGKSHSPKTGTAFRSHWRGFNFGFVNYAHLPETSKALELDWGASFAMQFKLLRYDISLSKRGNFGLTTGLGLEYQRLRFNNDNVSLLKSNGNLEVFHPSDEYTNIQEIRRSSLKNLYLSIPLLLEVQFPKNLSRSKRMYIAGGLMGGVRMHSKTKIVYDSENGHKYKKKNSGNFNQVPFKADAVVRIGYRRVNLWGSYTLTEMFKDKNFSDLHLYTIGFGVTI